MVLYREYKDKKFYKYLSKATKMYLIAMIISIIMLCVDIIYFILYCINIMDTFLNGFFYGHYEIFIIYIIYGIIDPIFSYFNYRNIKKTDRLEDNWHNDYGTLWVSIILTFAPLILSLLYMISIIFDSISGIAYFEMLGRMLLQYIFMIIASVYLIKCLKIVKNDYAVNPPKFMKEKIKSKRKEQQAKSDNITNQNYRNLMDIAGKKFFLKNYYIIRDLFFADAMDSIDYKYSYEDKEKRIQAVKKDI